ncbi:MAG: 50S ribosomal protein L6 [Patescibacteria group bacterium]
MSKIGKKPIKILQGVKIEEVEKGKIKITGKLGELFFIYPYNDFSLLIKENEIIIQPQGELDKNKKSLWGTLRALLNNKIIGVSQGFKKTLILQGIGYSAELRGNKIIFKLGASHPFELEIPEGIKIEIKAEKGRFLIIVEGIDKELVGQFAALIKALKPADRYHLKGFMYEGEFIPTKPVKKLGK